MAQSANAKFLGQLQLRLAHADGVVDMEAIGAARSSDVDCAQQGKIACHFESYVRSNSLQYASFRAVAQRFQRLSAGGYRDVLGVYCGAGFPSLFPNSNHHHESIIDSRLQA